MKYVVSESTTDLNRIQAEADMLIICTPKKLERYDTLGPLTSLLNFDVTATCFESSFIEGLGLVYVIGFQDGSCRVFLAGSLKCVIAVGLSDKDNEKNQVLRLNEILRRDQYLRVFRSISEESQDFPSSLQCSVRSLCCVMNTSNEFAIGICAALSDGRVLVWAIPEQQLVAVLEPYKYRNSALQGILDQSKQTTPKLYLPGKNLLIESTAKRIPIKKSGVKGAAGEGGLIPEGHRERLLQEALQNAKGNFDQNSMHINNMNNTISNTMNIQNTHNVSSFNASNQSGDSNKLLRKISSPSDTIMNLGRQKEERRGSLSSYATPGGFLSYCKTEDLDLNKEKQDSNEDNEDSFKKTKGDSGRRLSVSSTSSGSGASSAAKLAKLIGSDRSISSMAYCHIGNGDVWIGRGDGMLIVYGEMRHLIAAATKEGGRGEDSAADSSSRNILEHPKIDWNSSPRFRSAADDEAESSSPSAMLEEHQDVNSNFQHTVRMANSTNNVLRDFTFIDHRRERELGAQNYNLSSLPVASELYRNAMSSDIASNYTSSRPQSSSEQVTSLGAPLPSPPPSKILYSVHLQSPGPISTLLSTPAHLGLLVALLSNKTVAFIDASTRTLLGIREGFLLNMSPSRSTSDSCVESISIVDPMTMVRRFSTSDGFLSSGLVDASVVQGKNQQHMKPVTLKLSANTPEEVNAALKSTVPIHTLVSPTGPVALANTLLAVSSADGEITFHKLSIAPHGSVSGPRGVNRPSQKMVCLQFCRKYLPNAMASKQLDPLPCVCPRYPSCSCFVRISPPAEAVPLRNFKLDASHDETPCSGAILMSDKLDRIFIGLRDTFVRAVGGARTIGRVLTGGAYRKERTFAIALGQRGHILVGGWEVAGERGEVVEVGENEAEDSTSDEESLQQRNLRLNALGGASGLKVASIVMRPLSFGSKGTSSDHSSSLAVHEQESSLAKFNQKEEEQEVVERDNDDAHDSSLLTSLRKDLEIVETSVQMDPNEMEERFPGFSVENSQTIIRKLPSTSSSSENAPVYSIQSPSSKFEEIPDSSNLILGKRGHAIDDVESLLGHLASDSEDGDIESNHSNFEKKAILVILQNNDDDSQIEETEEEHSSRIESHQNDRAELDIFESGNHLNSSEHVQTLPEKQVEEIEEDIDENSFVNLSELLEDASIDSDVDVESLLK
eukprot:GDKJ01022813.1.p1 GENE.GDKJ01022813.1~~GDKJ01022813.1.p1  ORF type:complete len:1230 (+),score=271.72 GDKJ01022813.1:153-3692(+)